MTSYDIIIPTCKKHSDIIRLVFDIQLTSKPKNLIYSCIEGMSAAYNRNHGLLRSISDYVIMLDDDISGFSTGWADQMVNVLENNHDISMVSARLMDTNGLMAPMMDEVPDLKKEDEKNYLVNVEYVRAKLLPSSCIAFRKTTMRFDQRYKGSGFEDLDFCFQMKNTFSDKMFVILNRIQLVHKNEKKNQSEFWTQNKAYFERKWKVKL